MSGLFGRLAMMQVGGGELPTFVDYIWPGVGNPSISINLTSGKTRVSAKVIFRSAIPNDNNSIITLGGSNNNNTSAYIQDKIFRMWHGRTSASRNTNITASPLTPYTITMTPNTNLTGFIIGVDNAGWTGGVSIDNYVRLLISIGGTHVIPVAYGRVDVKNRIGGAGDLTYTNIAELRPCIFRGEYGMWDNLTGTFHGNTVSGASWTGGSIQS